MMFKNINDLFKKEVRQETVLTTFRIEKPLLKKLRLYCAENETSMRKVLTTLVKGLLDENEEGV